MNLSVFKKKLLLSILLLPLVGCQQTSPVHNDKENGFTLSNVAKSDMDMLFDHQVAVTEQLLRELMLKLYLRNPYYWRSDNFESAQNKVDWIFSQNAADLIKQTLGKRSIESMQLAFEDDYAGDRILALVFGLKSMIHDSYGGRTSFFILDQLDPQKLYNAARNLEVAVWKLSNDRTLKGELFLVSNELSGSVKNLSFERLFGKLIATQDLSAQIVADSTNRTIKNVLQGVARYVFLPL
ncbi:MAG: hypothetical protein HKP55_04635 [Gammaproteobacteria bacterium]|nr:hypothetical protein [Gammaproteobacteria bacterium]